MWSVFLPIRELVPHILCLCAMEAAGGPATNDDRYDLYKISPENDHGRDDRFLTKILAEL